MSSPTPEPAPHPTTTGHPGAPHDAPAGTPPPLPRPGPTAGRARTARHAATFSTLATRALDSATSTLQSTVADPRRHHNATQARQQLTQHTSAARDSIASTWVDPRVQQGVTTARRGATLTLTQVRAARHATFDAHGAMNRPPEVKAAACLSVLAGALAAAAAAAPVIGLGNGLRGITSMATLAGRSAPDQPAPSETACTSP